MKKLISIISVLAVAAGLTACNGSGSGADNISDDLNSQQSEASSQIPESTQDTASSEDPVSSEEPTSSEESVPYEANTVHWCDLKGEELVAKIKWPYDDPIDFDGGVVERWCYDLKPTAGHIGYYEEIPLSEISNETAWHVYYDYGYLAMIPENGGEYEYKKYRTGDKIGDFTVTEIQTRLGNADNASNYFVGVRAEFDGEAVLTGEMRFEPNTVMPELQFYPDEESRARLPLVNFIPLMNKNDVGGAYCDSFDNLLIGLGNRKDFPEIDFENILTDGTGVKVKVKIKNYGYRAYFDLPFIGGADIVDGGFEIL